MHSGSEVVGADGRSKPAGGAVTGSGGGGTSFEEGAMDETQEVTVVLAMEGEGDNGVEDGVEIDEICEGEEECLYPGIVVGFGGGWLEEYEESQREHGEAGPDGGGDDEAEDLPVVSDDGGGGLGLVSGSDAVEAFLHGERGLASTAIGGEEPGGDDAGGDDGEETKEDSVDGVPDTVLHGIIRPGVVALADLRRVLSLGDEGDSGGSVDGTDDPNEADEAECFVGVEEESVFEAPVEEDEAVDVDEREGEGGDAHAQPDGRVGQVEEHTTAHYQHLIQTLQRIISTQ